MRLFHFPFGPSARIRKALHGHRNLRTLPEPPLTPAARSFLRMRPVRRFSNRYRSDQASMVDWDSIARPTRPGKQGNPPLHFPFLSRHSLIKIKIPGRRPADESCRRIRDHPGHGDKNNFGELAAQSLSCSSLNPPELKLTLRFGVPPTIAGRKTLPTQRKLNAVQPVSPGTCPGRRIPLPLRKFLPAGLHVKADSDTEHPASPRCITTGAGNSSPPLRPLIRKTMKVNRNQQLKSHRYQFSHPRKK